MSSASQPAPAPQPASSMSVQAIVALVGKGMSAREILDAFPTLSPSDIRSALLQAVEVVCDKSAALEGDDRVSEIMRRAQQSSNLSAEEAQALADEETRAVRFERARRRNQ